MKNGFKIIFWVCLLCFSSVSFANDDDNSNIVAFEIIDNGSMSGAKQDKPVLHPINDQDSWQDFWNKHITVVPKPAAPGVDFDTKTVIAVVDSDQPNSGYYLRLERIERQGDELWVYATREQPGADCLNLGMVAQPFVIASIDKVPDASKIKLIFNTSMYDC